jgi:alkylhydroperoxidase family enzyme
MSAEKLVALVHQDVEEPHELLQQIRSRRKEGRLLNLDRKLLHSPPFAAGWSAHCGAVRTKLECIKPKLVELAIIVVGIVNQAEYEVVQHCGPFLEAAGNKDGLVQLALLEAALWRFQSDGTKLLHERDVMEKVFNEEERLVIECAEAISKDEVASRGPTGTLHAALQRYKALHMEEGKNGDQAVVELVGVISTYNMVSRFLCYTEVSAETGDARGMIEATRQAWKVANSIDC